MRKQALLAIKNFGQGSKEVEMLKKRLGQSCKDSRQELNVLPEVLIPKKKNTEK